MRPTFPDRGSAILIGMAPPLLQEWHRLSYKNGTATPIRGTVPFLQEGNGTLPFSHSAILFSRP